MLKIGAIVVGVAAITLSGGIALFGAPAVAGALGATGAAAAAGTIAGISVATLATVLSVSAAVLSVAAGLLAKPPKFGSTSAGQQLDFIADPLAGEPYVMGNARVGMNIVHEASWGDKNKYLGMIGVLCCAGPVLAYDGLYADDTLVNFSGGNASGYYANFMHLDTQLGARPEASALDMSLGGGMPNWTAASKLSSLAAAGLILTADVDNGKVYSGGVPQITHQMRGVYAYDSRLDSTNGGTGTQRALDESTYAYSENPWVHASTYAIGRWVNGVRVIGPGLPTDKVDWASFREAANIADANGWAVSGRVMSTDRKWDVLKSIAQAGGGYPIPTGAKLAALVNTPRVSLETIEEEHLKGPVSVPQMSMRRQRLNGGIPRFREPSQAWQVVSGATVRNADYLSADGGNAKTKEIDLPLVADKDQAAQLAAYEVANSRERSPISLELDLYWSQYKMGDCLTLNIPSALLFNQKCVIIGRALDATKNTVRFDFRTEDDAKHTWAMGLTGSTPTATVGSAPGTGDEGTTSTDFTGTLDDIPEGTIAKQFTDPEKTKLTGVEAGATKSRVFRQATAPASPTVNDTWVDTSVTPNAVKVWNGSAWVASANLTTNVDQLGDGATYGRPLLSRLNSGRPVVDLSEPIHLNKTADNIAETTTRKWAAESGADVTTGKSLAVLTNRTAANISFAGGATVESLKPAEAGAEVTTGKSLTVLTGRTLDNIADTGTRAAVLATRVNAGRPVIDLSETIHANVNLDYVGETASFKKITDPQKTALTTALDTTTNIGQIKTLPAGDTNRVRFSQFEGGTKGWVNRTGTAALFTEVGSNGMTRLRADVTITGAGQNSSICTKLERGYYIAANAPERLYVGCSVAILGLAAGSTWVLRLLTLDATGAVLSAQAVANGSGGATVNGNFGAFLTTSADAAFHALELAIDSGSATSGTVNMWIAKPIVCSAGASQTAAPSWTPGPGAEYGATLGAVAGPGGNLTGAVDSNGRATVDLTQAGHIGKNLDNIGDTGTWSRVVASRVNAGRPVVDLSEGIHANLNTTYLADGAKLGVTAVVIDPPTDVVIYADSTGTVKPGELTRNVALTASVGTSAVTTAGAWSRTVTPGVTCTIGAATGVVAITALSASEVFLPVTFVYNGITRTAIVHIVRQDDPPTNSGGSGSTGGTTASTTTLGSTTGTAYDTTNAVSATLTVKAGSGGQVQCSAPVGFRRTSTAVEGETGALGKWQWRVVGGTFADIAAEVTSSFNAKTIFDAETGTYRNQSGSLSVTQTKTGLTNGTSYEFRFLWRRSDVSGTASNVNSISGTLSATGS